ncbi:MAG: tetratricopeptide repeat protein [Desulfosarcinaceae bacterium]|nr:tetratricopeptide repeat protein [Desulfosarcinaceae bacterium]
MLILTCLVYSNTFEAGWHLDDFANIVSNKRLHLSDLSGASILKTFSASPWGEEAIYRPVSCLTLALNWYVGQRSVVGYHVVNLVIHCLTALFLLKTVLLLFDTPRLADHKKTSQTRYWIALMAATLWAVHPIQTQAVTYIVQRMAQLAGLFYIIGIFSYLHLRLAIRLRWRLAWCTGVIVSFLLAIGAKENAAIFPLSLLLIEVVFFRTALLATPSRRLWLPISIVGAIMIGTIAALHISEEAVTAVFDSYATRHFNHSERLLTEFRVLFTYLSQLVYPNPALLSIEHDVTISTGLLAPWTTLPAIIATFAFVGGALYLTPKYPLACFGILWFYLQHTVESTILPLELVFEHRNYIPSMFLFVGAASGFTLLLEKYRDHNVMMKRVLVASASIALIFISIGTYSRNADWRTEQTLWEDAVRKAPGSSRAKHNLAWGYYEPIGESEKALALYRESLAVSSHRKDSPGSSLHNIGNIYYQRDDYKKAITYFTEALNKNPNNIKTHLRLVHSYIGLSNWEAAEAAVDRVLDKAHLHGDIPQLKGFILLNRQEPQEALKWFRRAMRHRPTSWNTLAGIGHSLHLLGNWKTGDFFLRRAQAHAPGNLFIVLNRLELHQRAGNVEQAKQLADVFVSSIAAGKLNSYVDRLMRKSTYYPLDYQRILPLVKLSVQQASTTFEQFHVAESQRTDDYFADQKTPTATARNAD